MSHRPPENARKKGFVYLSVRHTDFLCKFVKYEKKYEEKEFQLVIYLHFCELNFQISIFIFFSNDHPILPMDH